MKATQETAAQLKENLKRDLDLLRALRDDIRVELHLAGMAAKDRWKALEPQIAEAEKMAIEVTDASKQSLATIVKSFREFRSSLAKEAISTKPANR